MKHKNDYSNLGDYFPRTWKQVSRELKATPDYFIEDDDIKAEITDKELAFYTRTDPSKSIMDYVSFPGQAEPETEKPNINVVALYKRLLKMNGELKEAVVISMFNFYKQGEGVN
jgi:hypothetical protein